MVPLFSVQVQKDNVISHSCLSHLLNSMQMTTPSSVQGSNVDIDTLIMDTHTHTYTMKQMWREFPLAAGAFESSSGIPFSLPNMGGFVREREAERGTPSWCQSFGTVSLTLTGNPQEGMWEMQESPKCYPDMHVCKVWILAHMPHVYLRTLTRNVLCQFSQWGDIPSRKVLPPPTTTTTTQPTRRWLLIPSITCLVWGLWLNAVFPYSPKTKKMVWGLQHAQLCCLE